MREAKVTPKPAICQAAHTHMTYAASQGGSYPTLIAANCTTCPNNEYLLSCCYLAPHVGWAPFLVCPLPLVPGLIDHLPMCELHLDYHFMLPHHTFTLTHPRYSGQWDQKTLLNAGDSCHHCQNHLLNCHLLCLAELRSHHSILCLTWHSVCFSFCLTIF